MTGEFTRPQPAAAAFRNDMGSIALSTERGVAEMTTDPVPQAAILLFERTIKEYATWRAVPEAKRSPAPAWWWQPAVEMLSHTGEMSPLSCANLEIAERSTWSDGADVLMAALADQTSPSWPEEFPKKIERLEEPEKKVEPD